MIKITLEDKGQDFTTLYTDDKGMILDSMPFGAHLWRGGMIPINDPVLFKVGQTLPIHHPPHINYGFLKYRIQKIENTTTP